MENIFITGKTGVGKTQEAMRRLSVARSNWNAIKGRYHAFAEEKDYYKVYFAPEIMMLARIPKEAIRIVEEACKANTIIIDDLGVNKVSEYNPDIIYIIINKRLESKKSTIVTSNLNIEEISNKIDDRLASRLATYELLELVGEDKRLTKKL